MTHADADRNLIFGILALQMDFLSRDALIAGLNAWVLQKTRSLGRVLVEQGALAEDEHDLLDALLHKHLEKHRGDPEESLSAVGRTRGAPADLLDAVADPELRASLSRLGLGVDGETASTSEDPDRTRSFAVPPSNGEDGGASRFRILRPHAEGGLGRIFVAMDRELNRQVALKQIKDERADFVGDRSRFVFEAEVTGGLEHPGIVPVYAMGRSADGRPYYAMRLVKGEPLREAIRRHHAGDVGAPGGSMGLRRLIGRLVAVCNAVAYAHSRGMIHRDIKPSNIMLGRYDETLVVDWGLAKAIDRPDPEGTFLDEETLRPSSWSGETGTLPGYPIGTPRFMSPEQAMGWLAMVGPASDIYSLGATLHCILTGRPPTVAGPPDEEPTVPMRPGIPADSDLGRPGIPPPLAAVARRAMATQPRDRYASALELAADLERWLADEPVSAHRESIPARAGRWVRRHRPAVAAAATLLIASVVGLAINNDLVRRQRDRARDAERRAEESLARESSARKDAEASLALARSAVNQMLVKVAEEELPYIAELGDLRKDVAREALGFAREFLRRHPSEPAIRAETAMLLRRVANIERMTRDYGAALKHYDEGEALYRGLVDDFPARPGYRDELVLFLNDIAGALQNDGRGRDAMIRYERAIAMAREQAGARPDAPGALRALAMVLNDSGAALHEVDRNADGLSRCDEAVSLFARLAARPARDRGPFDPLLHLVSLVDRAPLQRETGRLGDATAALARAVEMARAMLAEDKDNLDARYYLALALLRQGTIRAEGRDKDELAGAEAALDESVRLLADLQHKDRGAEMYPPAHAEALMARGAARLARGRPADADADAIAALRILDAIPPVPRPGARTQELSAAATALRARIAARRGDRGEADALWGRAVALQDAACRARPDNPRSRKALDRLRADRQVDDRPHP